MSAGSPGCHLDLERGHNVRIRTRLFLAALGLALAARAGSGAEPTPAKEAGGMEVRTYGSSQDPALKLSAEFHVPAEPKPLCLCFHGWHQSAAVSRTSEPFVVPLARQFFVVNVDMRGRGAGTGTPDASGHELIDGLDALEYARKTWPSKVRADAGPYLFGGSGGGGNVLALAGKAPDMFSAAVAYAGMSDYALWYQDDKAGQYRDEMETRNWIGGNPATNPEGYRSRGGLHVLSNVLAHLLVIHGTQDSSVPFHHAENYKKRAEELQKQNVGFSFWKGGHSLPLADIPKSVAFFGEHAQAPRLPAKGRLLVHSFLACRNFWLILDHPSRVGTAEYETAPDGELLSLAFAQAAASTPVKEVVLRLSGDVAALSLDEKGGPRKVERWRQSGAWSDFRWKSDGPWTARVPGGPADRPRQSR